MRVVVIEYILKLAEASSIAIKRISLPSVLQVVFLHSFSFVFVSGTSASQLTTSAVVEMIAPILVGVGQDLSKHTQIGPPQILFAIGGTKAYGGCSDYRGSNIIPGSYYCPSTNTILLEVFQLDSLRSRFGDGAIAYALFHEFGHYVQFAFKNTIKNAIHKELDADCQAGMYLNWTSKKLKLDDDDIREIYSTAYSIGGSTHGLGSQRLNAVKYGFENGDTTGCVANALKDSQITNTVFRKPTSSVSPPNVVEGMSKTNSRQRPQQNSQIKGYLGEFQLWGRIIAKVYKVKSGEDNFKVKTMSIRYVDTGTGIGRSSLVYIDCNQRKWSFFPDSPSSEYSMGADARILKAAGC